jgi:hypothetical protein
MDVVYFPEELHARAPTVMGVLCVASSNTWVHLFDIIEFIKAGETVTIRPASASELQRAEGRIVLYEIGVALGAQISSLLDHEPPEETDKKLEGLRDVLASYDMGFPDLVDSPAAPGAEQPAADVPVDAIPEFCAALHQAYADGDLATALTVSNHIGSMLLDSVMAQSSIDHGATSAA